MALPGSQQVIRLRDFRASPASGRSGTATWQQAMGSIVFRLPLRASLWGEVSAHDFEVKVCDRGLLVSSPARPEASEALQNALCGVFPEEILPRASVWYLEEDDCSEVGLILTLRLCKAKDGSWPTVFVSPLPSNLAELSTDWLELSESPGKGGQDDQKLEESVGQGFSLGSFVERIVEDQSEEVVTLRLILNQKLLDEARAMTPMSRMWGLDLTQDELRLFSRLVPASDAVVLAGRLEGRIEPSKTHWSMSKVTLAEGGCQGGSERLVTRPALEIQLVKAVEYRRKWDNIIDYIADVTANRPSVAAPGVMAPGALEEEDALRSLDLEISAPALEDEASRQQLGVEEVGGQVGCSSAQRAASRKVKGDEAFKRREWKQAVVCYSEAISLNPEVPAFFSNRSAALVEMGDYQAALEDGKTAGSLDQSWPKPFFRQGIALRALKRFDMAISSFASGQSLDPKNPSWQREIDETELQKAARKAARERRR